MRVFGWYIDLVVITDGIFGLSIFGDHLAPNQRHRPAVLENMRMYADGLT